MAKGQRRSDREPKKPKAAKKPAPPPLVAIRLPPKKNRPPGGIRRDVRATMTDEPVNLDEHRGMAAQKDTEIRRDLREVQVDQAALRARLEKLEPSCSPLRQRHGSKPQQRPDI